MQPGVVGGFEQGTELWCHSLIIFDRPEAGEARIAVVAAQPAGFGELGGSAFRLAGEGACSSELVRREAARSTRYPEALDYILRGRAVFLGGRHRAKDTRKQSAFTRER